MLLSDQTGHAIEACYDAILDPLRWPSALQLLGESLGADSCTFASCDPVGDWRVPRSEGHEAFAQLWLRNQPHFPDPHDSIRLPRGQADRCYFLEEDVSDEDMRRTLPYYRETARPENRDWWAGARFRVEGRRWCFSLYRGADKGPFTVEDARTSTAVTPDLSRIIALSEKFGDARLNFGVKLVQELNVAAILLDATGKALQMSSRAQELLGPDFHLIGGDVLP